MEHSLAAIKVQFDLNTSWFNNALDGITNEVSHVRHEQINHMKWIAGHLLNTRVTSISRMAGLPVDESYTLLFSRGAGLAEAAAYPPLDEIMNKWKGTAGDIANALVRLPNAVLMAKSPAQLPIADDTILGMLAFLIAHEAFHIGQLSIIRQVAGHAPMTYGV